MDRKFAGQVAGGVCKWKARTFDGTYDAYAAFLFADISRPTIMTLYTLSSNNSTHGIEDPPDRSELNLLTVAKLT